MKKSLLLLLCILSIFACNDDAPKNAEEGIPDSTWILLTAEVSDCDEPELNEIQNANSSSPCSTGQIECRYSEISFTETNWIVSSSETDEDGKLNQDNESGSYTLEAEFLIFCQDGECQPYAVDFSGNNMTWIAPSDDGSGCIFKATFESK